MGNIVVSNVSKAYKRYPNKWARMLEWITGRHQHKKAWVLRDINFTIEPGEAVGIVGINGAGKSTLLKIITGTTQPTTGSVRVDGRVAALLELGMGFHADFTGRQNAYMTGQLLGYSVHEIDVLMPRIEAFADIGDYIDQPLRMYSSGMQVRLAFAVSTATRPDVLIVDEALSVGDAAFQRKCFRRIQEYKEAGTTLLFVSHDTETVKKICDRAIFVNGGIISKIGKARSVCDAYERLLFGVAVNTNESKNEIVPIYDATLVSKSVEVQYGSRGAEITNVSILDAEGAVTNIIPEGHPISVNYDVGFNESADCVNFGMMVKSVDGVCVYATNANANIQNSKKSFQSGESARVRFSLQGNLVPGTYYLNVGVTKEGLEKEEMLHRRVDVLIFRVVSAHPYSSNGFANLFGNVEVKKVIVIVAGMQRSGSTFSYNVVRELLDARGGVSTFSSNSIDGILSEPDDSINAIVKSHSPDAMINAILGKRGVPCVCTVRKPEDAIASWMNVFGFSLEDSVATYDQWLSWHQKMHKNMLNIKYEDVDNYSWFVIRRISEYLFGKWSALEVHKIWLNNKKSCIQKDQSYGCE